MEGVSLGSAYLRLYGDRSALDRELEKLKRYTDQLEKQGIKVKFDADTGKATREVDGLRSKLTQLNQALQAVGQGMRGDGDAWGALGQALSGMGKNAAAGGGAMGKMAGMLGGAAGAAMKFIPILGQLGMAAMGVQAIFQGVAGAINGVLGPLKALAAEAGRFNQQVAEGSIFAAQSFAVIGPDGKTIQGTANQMRALRGTITKEYKEIQKEVAKISGATSAEIYEGFNLILQNAGALGKEGESLENIRKLSTKLAAGMNTLGIPGAQLRSEVTSLMTGDVQMYDQLSKKLGYDRPKIEKLKAEGKFYDDLMKRLEKLYDGQAVLAESLNNVASNFADVFQTISVEGGMALERGLGKSLKNVLDPLTELQGSFAMAFSSLSEALEPILRILGEIGGWAVSLGSILASLTSVIVNVLSSIFSFIEALASPALRNTGKTLQVIAKSFELLAASVGAGLRVITAFFRIFSDTNSEQVDDSFDPILSFFDDLIEKANNAAIVIAKPFKELAKWQAWVAAKATGKSDEEIQQALANVDAKFDSSLNTGRAPSLRSLNYSSEAQKYFAELDQRYAGSKEQKELAHQRELTKLTEDRIKNEIGGLENVLKLMQAQKSVQEALNGLAEDRRGIAMQRAGFQMQIASSPEVKQEAEDRRNELAAQQEQQRIRERKALLGTERQMLQVQLEIQIKQQRIQELQLQIQRREIEIQLITSKRMQREASEKLRNSAPGSPEQAVNRDKFIAAGKETQLRQNQLDIMDQTLEVAKQGMATTRQINALEQDRLNIENERLGIQSEGVALTLEQQRIQSQLAKEEQAIKNALNQQLEANKAITDGLESQIRAENQSLKTAQDREKLEKAKLDLQKAQLETQTQTAEQELKVAQAQREANQNPRSARAVIAAEIEALATGNRAQRDVLTATRALYDAKERQMAFEQEMQRAQLKNQQARELSETKIYMMQLKIAKYNAENAAAQEAAQAQLLGITQRRDQLGGGVSAATPRGDMAVLSTGTVNANDPTLKALANTPAVIGAVGRCTYNVLVNAMEKIGARSAGRVRNQLLTDSSVGRSLGDGNDPRNAVIGLRQYGWVPLPGAGRRTTLRNSAGSADVNLMTGAEYAAMANAGRIPSGALLYSTRHSDPNGGAAGSSGYDLAIATNGGRGHNNSRQVNRPLVYGGATKWVAVLVPKESISKDPGAVAQQAVAQQAAVTGAASPGTAQSLEISMNANTRALTVNTERITEISREETAAQAQLAEQQRRHRVEIAAQEEAFRRQEQERFSERRRAELTAQYLDSDIGRFATDVAENFVGAFSSSIKGALNALRRDGTIDIKAFFAEILGGVADRLFEASMNLLLAPLEKGLQSMIVKGITGLDPAKIEAQVQAEMAASTQLRAAEIQLQAAHAQASGASGVPGTSGPFSEPGLWAKSENVQWQTLPDFVEGLGTSTFQLDQLSFKAAFASENFTNLANTAFAGTDALGAFGNGLMSVLSGLGGGGGGGGILGTVFQIGGAILGGLTGGSSGGNFMPVDSLPSVGAFNPLPTAFSLSLPGRASGGPVTAQSPYMVGERGPEVFVPKSSGNIIPNDALGGSTSIVINVDAKGSKVDGDPGEAKKLGAAFSAAIQQELIKQKRPGGLLA